MNKEKTNIYSKKFGFIISKHFSKKKYCFLICEVKQYVSEKKPIKNWTPWMILGCLYYTMYIENRSGGTVLNLVGTSKSKTSNVIKKGQNYYNMHTSFPKNSITVVKFSFSEKATKICAICRNLLSKRQNHKADWANFCGLLRKTEL